MTKNVEKEDVTASKTSKMVKAALTIFNHSAQMKQLRKSR